MAGIAQDTAHVKEEFEGLSNATQIFIWSLVGLGVVIGVLIGGFVGFGIAVDEVDGRDCIEHDEVLYCADEA
jgi:uncharacterized membrane protein